MNSGKFVVLDALLKTFRQKGDKTVIFSRSIDTLTYMEERIPRLLTDSKLLRGCRPLLSGSLVARLDGRTPADERTRLIGRFNDPEDSLFVLLVSTKAGGEGITLTGGNRVIIFDVSFNPCVDGQAARRCYRYGQTKEV